MTACKAKKPFYLVKSKCSCEIKSNIYGLSSNALLIGAGINKTVAASAGTVAKGMSKCFESEKKSRELTYSAVRYKGQADLIQSTHTEGQIDQPACHVSAFFIPTPGSCQSFIPRHLVRSFG